MLRDVTSETAAGPVIRTVDLTKAYDGRVAVDRANLVVQPGEIYGFLGPNGAGKTTTIRMILGLLQPTRGRVELWGQDIHQAGPVLRSRIGVVGEQSFLYDDMTALDYLMFFARLFRVADARTRSEQLLERLDLAPFAQLLARDFSQGMQRKLSVARALLHDPDLLILDEPVAGLDPYGIVQVRELLEERREAGRAVLVSSHILSEVERTADRISIIHRGHVLVEDSLDSIIRRLSPGTELEIELQGDIAVTEDALASLPGIRRIDRSGSVLVLEVEGDQDLRPLVSQTISKSGATVVGMKQRRASLEEAFVRLTEGKLRQAGFVTGEENPNAGEA